MINKAYYLRVFVAILVKRVFKNHKIRVLCPLVLIPLHGAYLVEAVGLSTSLSDVLIIEFLSP